MDGELYTVDEIAIKLKVHPQSVYRWIYDGKLESLKIEGIVRISSEALDKFIKAG